MKLQELYRRVRGASPQSQAGYESLVKRVADGQHVDESEIAEALAGREADAFSKDVERLQARRSAAATLEKLKADQKQHDALLAEHKAAQVALQNLPIVKMLNEMHEAQAACEKLRVEAFGCGAAITQARSTATHVLRSTASKSIYDQLAKIQGQINGLEHDRRKFALSDSEAKEYATARDHVAALPARITALKKTKAPDAAVECVALTARLVSAKATVKHCAERIAEAEKLAREIAGLEAKKDHVGNAFMDPDTIEFLSQPAPLGAY